MGCMKSSKGGKRGRHDTRPNAINPCFCHPQAKCIINGVVQNSSADCPVDGSASCIEDRLNLRSEVPIFLEHRRDCSSGQRAACTYSEPCTPCELDRLAEFDAPRCLTCSLYKSKECNFVEGVG